MFLHGGIATCLVRFNKDNKTNDNSSWNDYLLGDVILSAYINLLSLIASRLTDKILFVIGTATLPTGMAPSAFNFLAIPNE
jgi:hypothetical protein